jgi:hypothetical protein
MVAVELANCDPDITYKYFRNAGIQIPVIPLRPHRKQERCFLRLSWFNYNTISDLKYLIENVSPHEKIINQLEEINLNKY